MVKKSEKELKDGEGAKDSEGGVATIEVPLGEVGPGEYAQTHVSLNLNPGHAMALKRLRRGLYDTGATLKDGKMISSNADAIRYLLDQASGV